MSSTTSTRFVEGEDGLSKSGCSVLVHVTGREIIWIERDLIVILRCGLEGKIMDECRERKIREVSIDSDVLELDLVSSAISSTA